MEGIVRARRPAPLPLVLTRAAVAAVLRQLQRKHPNVAHEWRWHSVFPATRHDDIRTIQELLAHRDVATTMIYTDVLNRGERGVRSPLDEMR
jgi:integrase